MLAPRMHSGAVRMICGAGLLCLVRPRLFREAVTSLSPTDRRCRKSRPGGELSTGQEADKAQC